MSEIPIFCYILKQYSSVPYLRVFSLCRCVPQHDSSLALGIQWIIARCLGKSLVIIFCVLSVHLKSLLCVVNYARYWLETKMVGKNQVIVISFINHFIMVCIIMFNCDILKVLTTLYVTQPILPITTNNVAVFFGLQVRFPGPFCLGRWSIWRVCYGSVNVTTTRDPASSTTTATWATTWWESRSPANSYPSSSFLYPLFSIKRLPKQRKRTHRQMLLPRKPKPTGILG